MMHQGIKNKIFCACFAFLFGISFASTADAASFSVTPQELTLGQETTAILNIDTEGEEINAVEMRLKFSPDDFLIKDASDGNSIINLWVEKSGFSNEKGEIYFSGIIPGGFKGGNGQLLKIVLLPKKVGEKSFEIKEAKVLLNDGIGTQTDIKISNLQFNVRAAGIPAKTTTPSIPAKDTEPPEPFTPQIARDPNIFGGKYFLVFATQDKISGIAEYFIRESPQRQSAKQISAKDWIAVESPYLLRDQKLTSYIYVKAVDKARNERIEMLPPQKVLPWYRIYQNYLIYGIIAVMAFFSYLIWRKFIRKNLENRI